MLRAHLTEEKRCYNHPHRIVVTACARCRTPLCDECLTTHTEDVFARLVAKDERRPPPLFCARCVDELLAVSAAEAERRRPLHQRLRPTRAGLQRASIYLAVIAVIMVPMALPCATSLPPPSPRGVRPLRHRPAGLLPDRRGDELPQRAVRRALHPGQPPGPPQLPPTPV